MSYIGKQPAESALTTGDITDGIVTTVKLADDAVTAAKVADGIIVNAAVSSTAAIDDTKIAPPYYAAVANLPTAGDHHGRVAHAHSEGKMYYSHGGSWIALAKDSDLPTNPALLASTQTFSGTNTFSAPARGTETVNTDASFDMSVTNNFKCTLTGTTNRTITFTNLTAGQSGNIYFDNSASGSRTISKHGDVLMPAADLTAINTIGVYWLSYYSDGSKVLVTASAALT